MTGEVKLAVGLLVTVGAAIGVGVGVARASSTPATALPPMTPSVPPGTPVTPSGPSIAFTRATGPIKKGQAVAVSIAQADLQTVATAAGVTADVDGLVGLISSSTSAVPKLVGTSAFIIYDPGTALPPSWPKDDPSPATEYHLAFVAGATFDPTLFPIPAMFWTGAVPTP
jgi:hypothetical protein